MITVNFACPDRQLYVDIDGGGNPELRDRTYAALINTGFGGHRHTVAWEVGTGHHGFDLAVIAAILTNAAGRDVRALEKWTIAGHVGIDGRVTGGVISNGTHARPIKNIDDLAADIVFLPEVKVA